MVAQLPLANDPSLQSNVAQAVNQSSASFNFLLRKMVPVMLCMAWEGFREELEAQDNPRYLAHFAPMTKWYNEPIREIALIRHCITHHNGKVSSEYLSDTRLHTFSSLGQVIDFQPSDLDSQFKTFEDAYNIITT